MIGQQAQETLATLVTRETASKPHELLLDTHEEGQKQKVKALKRVCNVSRSQSTSRGGWE